LNRNEFTLIHNQIVNKHKNKKWDWKWFLNKVLNLKWNNRFGWFIRTIPKYLEDGMKVLDIAGGFGHFGVYLMVIENYKIDYAVFDLPVMEPITKDYFKSFKVKGKFISGDITVLPNFFSEQFDMVWLFSWCQIGKVNCKQLFSEIYKILKPNGTFMFNMAYKNYRIKFYREEELIRLLNKIGFKVEILVKDGTFAPDNMVVALKKTESLK